MRVWQLWLAGGAASWAQGRWDGQDDRADEHGSTEVRGGVRVAETVGSGDEVSWETSVWAISACPAKNRKII